MDKELCPHCEAQIVLKPSGDNLLSFNPDGTIHRCQSKPELKPIGLAVIGHTIEKIKLNDRVLTIFLSGDFVFELSPRLNDERVALNMVLVTPDGVLEEKGRKVGNS